MNTFVIWLFLSLSSQIKVVTCHQEDLEEFFRSLENVLERTDGAVSANDINIVEQGHRQLERFIQIIFAMVSLLMTNRHYSLAQLLENLAVNLSLYFHTLEDQLQSTYSNISDDSCGFTRCEKEASTGGRPRYQIDPGIISSLKESGFSWIGIARFFGVSESTIRRRRNEFGIISSYSEINDDELDELINDILKLTPNAGETLVIGSLRGRGIRVQRQRIRERLNILDGLGRALRKRYRIQRRLYNVRGPNHLWHIDSNHKLIGWRMVLHGAVDGYSRTVLYVKCCNNNKAETALNCFMSGVEVYGTPLRVRADKGVENWDIARFMVNTRGVGQGSFIAGKSVHNQRIERMWGDINRVVVKYYKEMFKYMEHSEFLDSLNEIHLLALHFIFLPRINRSLTEFQRQWNHHPLRTMNNTSPLGLWQTGEHPNHNVSPVPQELLMNYGIDDEGPIVNANEEENRIIVPDFNIHINDELWQFLQTTFDPLSDDGNHGINMYLSVLALINQSIQ